MHVFREKGPDIDVIGETAVVSFGCEIVYERDAERYHATGRDVWVFEKQEPAWLAVWHTMLDVREEAVK